MSTLLETLPPARPAELHAISIAKSIVGKNVLATTIGRGQAAITLAETRPEAKVSLWFHDKYQQQLLVKALQEIPTQLSLYCQSDPPPSSSGGQYDLAILPVFKSGEAEFTRDVLQSALQSLAIGGHLVSAIDNPNDKWLRSQLTITGETVRVRPDSADKPTTVCYILQKTRPSKKVRDLSLIHI